MTNQPPQKDMHIFHRLHAGIHMVVMIVAVVVLAVVISVLHPGSLSAGATENVSGWAWSGVAGGGWISLNCTNDATCGTVDYGVNINETNGAWSGSGWSSNVGWVDFNANSCGPAPTTNMTTGVTTGFAKVRAGGTGGFSGCINMAGNGTGSGSGVVVNVNQSSPNYGNMSGFAWSGDDVVANIDNTPANEWTTNGIADVGLGWIDFSHALVDLESDAEVDLALDGQCNTDVTFTWDTTNVDESSCVLTYTTSGSGQNPQTVSGFDATDASFTQFIGGPEGSNISFQMTCDHATSGDSVESGIVSLMCAEDPVFACNDGDDNDNDGVADSADPQCHTDCNAANPASYNPYDNNEGGTCLDPENNPNSPLNQTNGSVPIYIES